MHRIDWCMDDDPGQGIYFPPRVSRHKPVWMNSFDFPVEFSGLLDEIYVALHADSRRLSMMGVRALIDAVIRHSVGDQANFSMGLDSLVENRLISERNREIIAAAVEAGNASAHRGYIPTSDDLNIVIEIVEHLIHNELLAKQAEKLKSTTPSRKQAAKAKR
ncbi:MAG: DUF4145 domain-containing protein [Magnetococcus sp. YQC-3]